jgi:hypothetical protein
LVAYWRIHHGLLTFLAERGTAARRRQILSGLVFVVEVVITAANPKSIWVYLVPLAPLCWTFMKGVTAAFNT